MFYIFQKLITTRKFLFSILSFLAFIIFISTNLNVLAQTQDQIDLAKSFGIDIEELKNDLQQEISGIGRPIEDFTFQIPENDEQEDLSTYLGFRGDVNRFGEELFSDTREEFTIADDAQVPDDYLLGLGDEILIQYYGSENDQYQMQIDRNGSIILPRIGPVQLNGVEFSKAKELIYNLVNEQLVGVNAVVTLGKTKFINVFVAGNVNTPGVYAMPALSRVTHALYLAGGISELGTYRNIQVKRQGKLVGTVDLYDFLIYGDNSSDINLRPNDVILVGTAEVNLQITGAIKRPAVFELSGNESYKTIIEFAGGLAPGADLESVMYSSIASENSNEIINMKSEEKINFFDGDALHVKFKSKTFDKINVNQSMLQKASAIRVMIQGEVNFPGTYLLEAGGRISDLLERAGGPTSAAFLDGAVFTRETVRQREAFRARELAEEVRRQVVSSSQTQLKRKLDPGDVGFITEQLESYSGIGRVIIDLPRAIAGRTDADLILADGDSLLIPSRNNTVTVFGEVRRQSSYVYNPKLAIEDYITLAAGTTQLADEDNIYVIKANGNVAQAEGGWFKFGSNKIINEGDTIIVPVDFSYRQSLPFWRDVISIVYQGAVAVAAINGL